ncbi:MAG: transglutaminase-like domain-containing protein [Cytophagales bacterium]|nr:transglutaminase-like domain-containing protein [Bernardetiaceae bacterium]MDW8210335.1 transglutaminase-like domain-containing protein [Cytophagales bacterium]
MISTKEIKALVSLLGDEDVEIRQHVEARIMEIGALALPILEEQVKNEFNPAHANYLQQLIRQIRLQELIREFAKWKAGGCDLVTGLWLTARYEYPNLPISALQNAIQQLYIQAWIYFKPNMHPVDQVREFNHIFFNKLNFHPNLNDFTAVSNSMFNQVLETRSGNPISLCIAYMLIARKLGMPIYGVNMPNLFILIYQSERYSPFYINAFNHGSIYTQREIKNYLEQLKLPLNPAFYEPCSNLDIIRRMLRNLIIAFDRIGQNVKAREIKKILVTISPTEPF